MSPAGGLSSGRRGVVPGLEMRSHSHSGLIDYKDLAPAIDDVAIWRKFRETKLAKQGPARGLMAQPATRPPPRWEDDSWGVINTDESVVWGAGPPMALTGHSIASSGADSTRVGGSRSQSPSHAFLSPIQRSRKPGFSFLKGKKPPSALDIVTGTTDSDKFFRRLQLRDGSTAIVPVTGDTRLPTGARYVPAWGQMHSVDTQLGLNVKLLGSQGEAAAVDGRAQDEARGDRIHTMSLPSASRGRPVTATEPTRPPIKYNRKNDAFYLQVKSVEGTRLGDEAMNNVPPGTAGIGIKVSDRFPVISPFFRPISVRNHRSGGGDTAGQSRNPSPLDFSVQLQTILSHDFGKDLTDDL